MPTTNHPAAVQGLEVPCFSAADAALCVDSLASVVGRIELNRAGSYSQGGLTPPVSMLVDLLQSTHHHHHHQQRRGPVISVMIRPRGGVDFVYSDAEFAEMRAAVAAFKRACAAQPGPERRVAFVFGVLKGGGDGRVEVDEERNRELVELAAPFECVFHRAFDQLIPTSSPPHQLGAALRAVDACGFSAILTAGGPGSAADNPRALARLVEDLETGGMASVRVLLVGGGVRSSNCGAISSCCSGSNKVWLHSSCMVGGVEAVDVEEVRRFGDILGIVGGDGGGSGGEGGVDGGLGV